MNKRQSVFGRLLTRFSYRGRNRRTAWEQSAFAGLMSIAAISKRKRRAMLDLARIQIAARFARGRGRSLALSPLLQRDSPDCACPQASQQLTACYCWCASRPRQRPGQARQNRPLKVASSIASARTAAPTASFQRQATVQIAPV